MAKFEVPFEDTQKIFDEVIDKTTLGNVGIKIRILTNNTLKEIGKVVKANDLLKYIGGDDIIILINEAVFEQLQPPAKLIVAEELLAYIGYNSENDKLFITKPDVTTFSLLLKKIGADEYLKVHETIKLIFSQEKDDEEKTEQDK